MAITGMTTAASAMLYSSLAATALSTAVGVAGSLKQSQAQQAQAEYQADVARENQRLAEEQASAQRKQGYEDATAKRIEGARIIGQQRAQAGASGAAVDTGSLLDLEADTAGKAEADATNVYNTALDKAYNTELQAWNYGNQASAYDSQASTAASTGWLNAAQTGLGGIASMSSTWAKFQVPGSTTKKTGV